MAKSEEIVAKVAAKLAGKKAKVKTLKKEPENTSSKKLPKPLQKALEVQFSTKLDKVRVHTGGNAKDVAKSLNAKAFTLGFDLYFAKPGDARNEEMLAHELCHVIQQQNGRVKPAKNGKALVSK